MTKKMYNDDTDEDRHSRNSFKSYLEDLRISEQSVEDDEVLDEVIENIAFSSLSISEDIESGAPDVRHLTIGDIHLSMDENTWDAIKDIQVGEEVIVCLFDDYGDMIDYHVTRTEDDYVIFKEYEASGKTGKIDFASLSNGLGK
jgi:hypothetical protein